MMMKMTIAILVSVAMSFVAAAKTMEVYVNIPGQKPVHCLNAEVEYSRTTLMVTIRMPWGVTYCTHMSNVVMVERSAD